MTRQNMFLLGFELNVKKCCRSFQHVSLYKWCPIVIYSSARERFLSVNP